MYINFDQNTVSLFSCPRRSFLNVPKVFIHYKSLINAPILTCGGEVPSPEILKLDFHFLEPISIASFLTTVFLPFAPEEVPLMYSPHHQFNCDVICTRDCVLGGFHSATASQRSAFIITPASSFQISSCSPVAVASQKPSRLALCLGCQFPTLGAGP